MMDNRKKYSRPGEYLRKHLERALLHSASNTVMVHIEPAQLKLQDNFSPGTVC